MEDIQSIMKDGLINLGGEIKALGNGRIGGFGVLFTTADSPDLLGDFFDADTDFGLEAGNKKMVLYDHGMDPTLARRKLGYATLTKKEAGLWVEAQLSLRDEYEKALYEKLVKAGKAGWSSGSAGHLVSRVPSGKAMKITEWPIIEISITPTPAEPRTSVVALKSWQPEPFEIGKVEAKGTLAAKLTQYIEDLVDDGRTREEIVKNLAREAMMDAPDVEKVLSGETRRPTNANLKAFGRVLELPFKTLKTLVERGAPKSIKDLYADELAGRIPGTWEYESAYRCVITKIAKAARSARMVGAEYDGLSQIKEATASYVSALEPAVVAQFNKWVESEDMMDDDEFYLRSLTQMTADDFALFGKSTDFDEHSQLVVTALREIAARFRNNHEMRKSTKAGRVLSDKNRQRLATLVNQIQAAVTDCQSLLEETKPMASDTEKSAARLRLQRLEGRARIHRIGV